MLKDGYCPLCLKQKQEMEFHHCVRVADGGSDDSANVLYICATCHAILTHGSLEDRGPKLLAVIAHQIMYFGLDYYVRATSKATKGRQRYYGSEEYRRLEHIALG